MIEIEFYDRDRDIYNPIEKCRLITKIEKYQNSFRQI